MKCMSKTVMRYKQEQAEAECRKAYEEQLAKMSPEERKAYEEARHKRAVDALANLAAMNAITGRYYG